jgi:DNA-binding NtrC family response regulator
MSDHPPIVVYAPDLMIRQRLVTDIAAAGIAVTGAATPARLAERLTDGAAALVVEIDGIGVDGPALIGMIRATNPRLPILGFCAHTRAELMDAARTAGATLVVSRGELTRRPTDVIDRLLGEGEPPT